MNKESLKGSLVGQTLGKYHIEEQIGRGAMAEVYKAYHPHLDRYVAIKILHTHMAEKTGILGRFEREAKSIAALSHPNIVQVHDFDIFDQVYFMVMEYVDGITLKSLIKQHHSQGELIPLDQSIQMIHEVGKALAYAHERGVVHRDVKPANILISKSNRVVLGDFGLAKILTGSEFTNEGTMVGTPAYMAPEQGMGKPGDARSDIYSLGAILFQLSTGRLPFIADSPVAIVYKHVNSPLPAPRSINPEIPEDLENIILKAMAKNPVDRYQSVDRLLDDLILMDLSQITSANKLPGTVVPPFVTPNSSGGVTISLHVVDTGQILGLENGNEFTLGRMDGGVFPDIDLSPYYAFQQGVSRMHAAIQITDDKRVTIMDLNSTNGTWVNGKKASPEVAVKLSHGDVISLGKLMLQILIR